MARSEPALKHRAAYRRAPVKARAVTPKIPHSRTAGSLVAWSLWYLCPGCLVWSLGLGPSLVPWSLSRPLVLWSLGPLVLWSSGPLVLRPGLRVLGCVVSRQDAFKVICEAPWQTFYRQT